MRMQAVRAWKTRHPLLSEIAISILLGILIEICLVAFQPPTLRIVRKVGDDTADRMIRLVEQTTNRIAASPAFTFIDIDDATWAAWDHPLVTPRDKLAVLVDRAARSGALAIILDVDLAFPDSTEAEAALLQVLSNYGAGEPPLFLVRSLIGQGDGALPRVRATPYDAATAGKNNVVWASPLFERDADGRIRRWQLFADACSDGKPFVLPSTHLAAAAVARRAVYGPPPGEAAEPPLAVLTDRLLRFRAASCKSAPPSRGGTIDDFPERIPIEVNAEDASKRVIYRVAWKAGAAALGPLVDNPSGGVTQLVAVRPARLVLAANPSTPLPGLAGRIIVIGGSFAESGDWHQTPLGAMPGALMIINAVEALVQNGTPHEPGPAERMAISLGIIVAASLLTAFFRPSVAAFGLAFGLLMLMLASVARFQSGVMLDLAIPAVGAVIHDIGESFIYGIAEFRRAGWRWILKDHGRHRSALASHEPANEAEAATPSTPGPVP